MKKNNKKIFRVWRKMDDRYNGFEEILAMSPREAAEVVFNWDSEVGEFYFDYEVDLISEFGGDVVENYRIIL